MTSVTLLQRQKRIALRKDAISKNRCPNCNLPLRSKWAGGMSCSQCGWEK